MKIGFIGAGIMGSRMAANLLNAGNELLIYNRTKEKATELIDKGAQWRESPNHLASEAAIVFTMLSTPEVVEEVAFGPEGFVKDMKPGTTWVDSTTVNPSFSRRMNEKAEMAGVRFVDAPVAGSKDPAQDAQLIFLVGGDPEDVQKCEEYFNVMGRKTIHVGSHGAGASMKMVFNMLLGYGMFAFSEALVFGQSLGISRDNLMNVLLQSTVVPPFLQMKRHKMEESEYSPEFPLKWMRKDLQLASMTGYEHDVSMPGVNAIKEIFALAIRNGLGDNDMSAIYKFLNDVHERKGQ